MLFKGLFKFFFKFLLLTHITTVRATVTTLNDIIASLQARGVTVDPDPRGKYKQDLSGRYRHMDVPYNGGYGDRGVKYEHSVPESPTFVVYQGPSIRNEPFMLGPKDHLRFMIDFNFNGTGWQIIQFEWVRDDEDDKRNYNYSSENQLWGDKEAAKSGSIDSNFVHSVIQDVEDVDTSPVVNKNINVRFEADTGLVTESSPSSSSTTSTTESARSESVAINDNDSNGTHVHVDGEYEKNNFSNVSYNEDNSQSTRETTDIQRTIQEVLEYIKTNIIPTLP